MSSIFVVVVSVLVFVVVVVKLLLLCRKGRCIRVALATMVSWD